jgi:hypothetical protein
MNFFLILMIIYNFTKKILPKILKKLVSIILEKYKNVINENIL